MINGILGPDTVAQPPAQQQHAPPGYGQAGAFGQAPPGMGVNARRAAPGQAQPASPAAQQGQSPAGGSDFSGLQNMVSSLLDDDNDVPF